MWKNEYSTLSSVNIMDRFGIGLVKRFALVFLFIGISIFMCYLMPNTYLFKNSNCTFN